MEITDYLAFYAAALSTVIAYWNVNSSRAHIELELVPGLSKSEEGYISGVYLSIKNPSNRTVHINSVSLIYPYRRISWKEKVVSAIKYRRVFRYEGWVHNGMVFDKIETDLPVSIEPRKSHSIFLPSFIISEMVADDGAKRFAAVAQDALWRNKYSEAIDVPSQRDG